jgi:ubiquinone/menaquinone biosynthesis C-methylase UbiE
VDHKDRVIAQFTQQASAFASAKHIQDTQALDLLLAATGAGMHDRCLDVACGPGIVACHFAKAVQSATGIDLTPAMLEQARALQLSLGLDNLSWDVGDATALPYAHSSFSVVTSRYALHHCLEPGAALAEMVRVCRPGGTVAVMDLCVSEDIEKAERFNRMERHHDPSHVRAHSLTEHHRLFASNGLLNPTSAFYRIDVSLSRLRKSAFPSAEDALAAEKIVRESLHNDGMGAFTRTHGEDIVFSYPIVVLAAKKATSVSRAA